MNVVVFASRKGGSGKSTLAAHLAAHAHKPSRSCLLVDADPQGSLTLWHKLRNAESLPLEAVTRGVADVIKAAKRDGFDWVLVDTPPTMAASVADAIRTATLVVVRAAQAYSTSSRSRRQWPSPGRCANPRRWSSTPRRRAVRTSKSPMVTYARENLLELGIPVWGGQVTQRANFSLALAEGAGAKEYAADSLAANEMARLWIAIEKSVKAITGARDGASMHRAAA